MPESLVVTVAICTFNRADTLRLTLDQICRLEVPNGCTWEVLVIDNNSTDGTSEVALGFSGRLPIRVAREPRTGKSFALNLAVREARGKYILWTDDDALVDIQWLTRILAAFERTGAAFIFGRVVAAWPHDNVPRWYSQRVDGLFALLDYGAEPFIATDPAKAPNGVNFAGMAAAHRQLGEYRVDYGPRGNAGGGGLAEDYDIYVRALAASLKVAYEPDVVVRHMISEKRATKMFNWKKALLNQRRFYDNLVADPPAVPWLLGLPRYYYRQAIGDMLSFLRAFAMGDRPKRFFHELYVLRFFGLFAQSCRNGCRLPRNQPPESQG